MRKILKVTGIMMMAVMMLTACGQGKKDTQSASADKQTVKAQYVADADYATYIHEDNVEYFPNSELPSPNSVLNSFPEDQRATPTVEDSTATADDRYVWNYSTDSNEEINAYISYLADQGFTIEDASKEEKQLKVNPDLEELVRVTKGNTKALLAASAFNYDLATLDENGDLGNEIEHSVSYTFNVILFK